MVRPPCCDKVGIKKGPWTPEEDIILVSYIQEHGPGNWTAVPTNTGLLRCSKSCRLRWTNYLRPGIKRGNFTPHEERMIVHLQALLGNKWAAIASYLPQRTDNDIKNYWNTHLKKKLKKLQLHVDPQKAILISSTDNSKGHRLLENSALHASSAENISRLLENWMRSSSSLQDTMTSTSNPDHDVRKIPAGISDLSSKLQRYRPQETDHHGENGIKTDELGRISSLDHSLIINGTACDSSRKGCESSGLVDQEKVRFVHDQKAKIGNNPPLSSLEKWLLDENAGQVEGEMEIPPIF